MIIKKYLGYLYCLLVIIRFVGNIIIDLVLKYNVYEIQMGLILRRRFCFLQIAWTKNGDFMYHIQMRRWQSSL